MDAITSISEVDKNTATLRDRINQLCAAKEVVQGDGPAMAYCQSPPDQFGTVKRYVYKVFGNCGLVDEGCDHPCASTFADAVQSSIAAFDAWLAPRRRLVWRCRPEADKCPKGWRVYWRCVQIDDDARSLTIDWSDIPAEAR